MNIIYDLIPGSIIQAIGWTIFHSLWQGMLIAIVLGIAILATDNKSAKFRYALGVTSIFLMILSSIITFAKVYNSDQHNNISTLTGNQSEKFIDGSATTPSENQSQTDFVPKFINEAKTFFADHIFFAVNIWLFGLMIFSFRYLGGLLYIQRLRTRGINPMPGDWDNYFASIITKAGINKSITVFQSALVKVPVALGYFKPIILLPLGMISGLPQNQVEAIIAHEIAHIKRYDFVINLFQTLAETLYFYHPAVWWISSIVRLERENCCDDIAVELCGDSLTYSKALVNIQQMKNIESSFALAAIGSENQLFRRIKRMNENRKTRLSYGIKFAAFAILAMIIAVASLYSSKTYGSDTERVYSASLINPFSVAPDEISENTYATDFETESPDTSSLKKGKRTFSFYDKKDGDKVRYKAKLNNGKLEELFIDGEKVADSDLGKYESKIADKLNDYEDLRSEFRKNRNDYRKLNEEYSEKLREYRDKFRDYRTDHRNWNDEDAVAPDLAELREAMRELRHELQNSFAGHSVIIPPIPPIHIPEIHIPDIDVDIPDVHIPPIHVPPIHIPPMPPGNWDEWNDEFKDNMKEFNEKMKNHDWKMGEFKDSMKVFGEKMKVFGGEMKKFGKFIKKAKNEMIDDGLIDSWYDIDDFILSENKMEVNGKTISPELRKKYLDMYEQYTGKKLEGDKKIRIND